MRGIGIPFRRGRSTSIRQQSCPSRSYWLQTLSARSTKSMLAWCLGIPQMPLPPLTEISVETGRSTTHCPTLSPRRQAIAIENSM